MITMKTLAIPVVCAVAAAGAVASVPALAQDNLAFTGANLLGESEVGHKGAGNDAYGDFSAELDLDAGQMCYFLTAEGLDEVTAAHLHKAPKGKNGPPVVTLSLASVDTCIDVDPALLRDIAENEGEYYVNVHTAAFPQGAIRGQLD